MRLNYADACVLHEAYDQCVGALTSHGSLISPVSLERYLVRLSGFLPLGQALASSHEMYALLMIDTDYRCSFRVVDVVSEHRDVVWFEAMVVDVDDVPIYRCRWMHPREESEAHLANEAATDAVVRLPGEFPYQPPGPSLRPGPVASSDEPQPFRGYLGSLPPLGYQLAAESVRFNWKKARDYEVLCGLRIADESTASTVASSHSGREPLMIASGRSMIRPANLDAFAHRMLLRAHGDTWLRSGTLNLEFLDPVGVEDFVTVKGEVAAHVLTTDGSRAQYRVWAENQQGAPVFSGQASCLVP